MKKELTRMGRTDFVATSAGLNATPDTPAHPWSVAAARCFDIDLAQHKARLLDSDMVDRADVIFAMDIQNQAELLCRYPLARRKLRRLSAFAGKDELDEIRDPYHEGEEETKHCYSVLQSCIGNLMIALGLRDTRK
jgi:protein-tyrosine-phosphatase